MKNRIFELGLLALALTACGLAQATTYYVSDCQAGASAGCVAGSDSNSGTSSSKPWKTAGKIREQFSGMAAGDQILFARGGSWINASMDPLQSLKATATNPIVFDSYDPTWGGTERPILTESRKDTKLFAFDNNGAAVADGGYVLRNLDLRGNGKGLWGVFTSGAVSDLTMSNLNIQGFVIGVHCGLSIERVQLLNSTITNNGSQGILWGCNNSLVEGNTFDHNGYISTDGRDHSIYLNNELPSAKNVTVRGNKLLNNSVPISGGICGGVPLVAHGMWNGVTIENNTIYQAPGTANPGCWGIAIDAAYPNAEIFSNVVIRGNTIANVGGIGIGCASCVAPVIENNVIVMEAGPEMVGIQIPDRSRGAGDTADVGAIIRNNSIYFKSAPSYAQGISFATQNGSTAGSKLQVTSNLIYFAATSNGNHQCFDTTGVGLSNFQSFDYNLCYDASGNGRYSSLYPTLANAKSAGFDVHGLSANPMLVAAPSSSNGWSMALSPNSPAVNAGSLSGSASKDRMSILRSSPDIGAFEFVPAGTTDNMPPAAPSSVMVQ